MHYLGLLCAHFHLISLFAYATRFGKFVLSCLSKTKGVKPRLQFGLVVMSKDTLDNSMNMAVKEGFEPSMRDKPHTPLAGERLQPLGHLTVKFFFKRDLNIHSDKSLVNN